MKKIIFIGIVVVIFLLGAITGLKISEYYHNTNHKLIEYADYPPYICAGENQTVIKNGTVHLNGTFTYWEAEYDEKAFCFWDFDNSNGIQVDSIGKEANCSYNQTGNYTATFIVIAHKQYVWYTGKDYTTMVDRITITVV